MADGYMKVKDNGASGLALMRESVEDAQETLGVDALQNAVDKLNGEVFIGSAIVTTDFIQGTKRTDETTNPLTTRCSTKNVYSLVEGDKITIADIDSGLKAAIVGIKGSSFITASGWQTSNFTYTVTGETEGRYFVSVAKTNDTQNLTPSDIHTLKVIIGEESSAIDKIEDDINNIDSVLMSGGFATTDYIQGTRYANGNINNVNYRVCTKKTYNLTAGDTIAVSNLDSGLKYGFVAYSGGNFVYLGNALTEDSVYTVTSATEGTYFVSFGKTDDSALTPSAISTAKVIVGTYKFLNKINNIGAEESLVRSRYNGKKISLIGDSIDTYDQAGYKIDGYRTYYPADGVTAVEQTWWMQVINNSGAKLEVNASWSGSRVTDTHTDPTYPDFYDRVSLVGNPDIIFVTLGTNDAYNNVALGEYDFDTTYTELSESTFRTAYIKGIKALQALYPDAFIVCIAEWMTDPYKESILHICNTLACEFVDASDYDIASVVHPGPLGMMQIAAQVLYPTDKTLTQKHMAADAKVVGEEISSIKSQIAEILSRLT